MAIQAQIAAELEAIELELQKRRWREDPVAWAEERMGIFLWSKQKEILRAVAANRRVCIQSCHEIGKSFLAALVVAWWIDVHPVGEAFVVTSAPTAAQVRAILWREIGRMHSRGLPGRVNQTEWFLAPEGGKEELVAFGRKPDEHDVAAFQGIHARRVLYVFDEACGIPAPLWEGADSLIANDLSKALAIGNPDDPATEYYQNCLPGSGWKVMAVGAFDSPNFTGEEVPELLRDVLIGRMYVEEKRRRWAPNWYWVDENGKECPYEVGVRVVPPIGADPQDTNPYWQSKVLGQFPRVGDVSGLIPITWVRRAQQKNYEPEPDDEESLGVDVGGGGDASTGCYKKGQRYRILWENRNPDTMSLVGTVLSFVRHAIYNIRHVKVDVVGIGRGVVDRLKEMGVGVVGVNVGEAASLDPNKPPKDLEQARLRFVNYRAECWWAVREEFENNRVDLDPLDEDTAAELADIHYHRLSNGKIQIESKRDAVRRGVKSPNRADAIMLATIKPRKKLKSATWGR